MNRAQFMEQLEKLLSDISEDERREALDYYESYFDEAGPEREASVIQELGSPGKVAAIIKADLREHGEYTDSGSYEDKARESGQMPGRDFQGKEEQRRSTAASGSDRAERGYHPKPKRWSGTIVLIIILLIFLSPFLTGSIGGILGVLAVILFLPFIIVFGVGALVIGLLIGGVVTIFASIGACAAAPAMGVLGIGVGCILTAVSLIGLVFLVWFASRLLPGALRWFTDLCGRILNRGRRGGADA